MACELLNKGFSTALAQLKSVGLQSLKTRRDLVKSHLINKNLADIRLDSIKFVKSMFSVSNKTSFEKSGNKEVESVFF